jgi:glutaredoxin
MEKILLTFSECPPCKAVKRELRDRIESGEVREVEVDSEEGMNIINKLGIYSTPSCVIKRDDGKLEKCDLDSLFE